MKLVNTKFQPDRSVFDKVERYSRQGVERSFRINGQKVAAIIPRLDLWRSSESWLALKPTDFHCFFEEELFFGETASCNSQHHKLIEFRSKEKAINIGYFDSQRIFTGEYIFGHKIFATVYEPVSTIRIKIFGYFKVEEWYMKDGSLSKRGTKYWDDDDGFT